MQNELFKVLHAYLQLMERKILSSLECALILGFSALHEIRFPLSSRLGVNLMTLFIESTVSNISEVI